MALFFVAMLLILGEGATGGGRQVTTRVLHSVGVGLLALSGWLDGEMVYRHHLAIIPDAAALEQAEHSHHELRPHARAH